MPNLSAIITTYKRDVKILERALLSIINQTFNDIEIIIVNDYPEECDNNINIIKMIEEYKKNNNINYFVMDKNGGACKARNYGLSKATGKYVAFLDDDDEWLPNKAKLMIDYLEKNSDVKMVYSNANMYFVEKNKSIPFNKEKMPSGNIYKDLLKRNIIGSCSFPLFVKEELTKINGYNELMPASQDWELYLRFSKDNKIHYIDEILTKFYIHENDRISKNIEKRRKGVEMIYDEFKEEFEANKKLKQIYIFNRINIEIDDLNFKKSIKLWKEAVKVVPFSIIKNLRQLIKIVYRCTFRIKNI